MAEIEEGAGPSNSRSVTLAGMNPPMA